MSERRPADFTHAEIADFLRTVALSDAPPSDWAPLLEEAAARLEADPASEGATLNASEPSVFDDLARRPSPSTNIRTLLAQ